MREEHKSLLVKTPYKKDGPLQARLSSPPLVLLLPTITRGISQLHLKS